jgi:hypothetical protein
MLAKYPLSSLSTCCPGALVQPSIHGSAINRLSAKHFPHLRLSSSGLCAPAWENTASRTSTASIFTSSVFLVVRCVHHPLTDGPQARGIRAWDGQNSGSRPSCQGLLGRTVLGLSNLHWLEIWFNPRFRSLRERPPDTKDLVEKLRRFMI